ncbi:MAG: hypothetical protein A2508_09250 [Candidatus Lambdaproteobacteria bacterium RIFOXYD12_FULL_49_8]|uniref:Lipoprotein n=1 Tax=Candidatus Lambdaproteobacteria bacterium RIFOXYD2_FULL_50_16 TaxID=1817772 RepID=A0A1F6GD96_9PROT|nr:MAG: hypothetical protein A2527_12230 [Candidatus Lambdaproteobacteria bacterium RIFOXYD2_FULL_50_16]OGG98136.1 MAG: hypothetical protein A2508_09250 [Candidatus Lambdaproteobacteria bacterium RIFOXYD12_FULL_49_8]
MRSRLLVWCVALALVLPGCSWVKLGYGWADWYILYHIGASFDLDFSQKKEAQLQVAQLIQWHKRDELPKYAQYIEAIAIRFDRGVKPDDLDWVFDQYFNLQNSFMERLLPVAAPWMTGLRPENFRALERQFEEENQEILKNLNLPIEARKQEREDWVIKTFEDWLDDLEPGQEAKIKAFLKDLPITEEDRLADRKQRQAQFLKLALSTKATKDQFFAQLRGDFIDYPKTRAPLYNQKNEQIRQAWKGFLAQFYLELTPKQKSYFLNKAHHLAQDLHSLSQPI